MDGHTPDPLTDSALEREIETVLAVEPSPDFLARVRARVADEPVPTPWRLGRRGGSSDPPFRWAFAVAAAVAIVTTAVIWRSSDPARSVDGVTPGRMAGNAEWLAPPGPVEPQAPRESQAPPQPRVPRAAARLALARNEFPEVIVAENEARAFAVLMTNIRRMPLEVPLPAAPDPGTPVEVNELPTLVPVTVEQIEIKPLVEVVTLE